MKNLHLPTAWVLAVLLLFPLAASGADSVALIESSGAGSVNWPSASVAAR